MQEKTCFFFGKSISECSRHFQCFLDGLLQCQKLDNAKCHGWFLDNVALGRIKWCVFWHWRSNEANIILGCWILNGQWLPPLIKQDILWCIVWVSLDMFWYALISVAAYPGILQSFMRRMSALKVGHVNCVIPPFESIWFQRFATKHGECFESSLLLPALWMEVVLLVWNPFLTPKSGMLRVLCQCRNPWGGFLLNPTMSRIPGFQLLRLLRLKHCWSPCRFEMVSSNGWICTAWVTMSYWRSCMIASCCAMCTVYILYTYIYVSFLIHFNTI